MCSSVSSPQPSQPSQAVDNQQKTNAKPVSAQAAAATDSVQLSDSAQIALSTAPGSGRTSP
jgi:hypothetical protein